MAVSEKSLANLKPFQPGDERINRGGRPPGSATKLLRQMANETVEGGEEGETRARRIGQKLLELAEGGDVRAIQLYYDRVDGKARQSISLDVDADGWRERKVVEYMRACELDGEPKSREEAIADLAEEDQRFEDYE